MENNRTCRDAVAAIAILMPIMTGSQMEGRHRCMKMTMTIIVRFLTGRTRRRSRNFSLERLNTTYEYCFGQYAACSIYKELLVERRERRAREAAGLTSIQAQARRWRGEGRGGTIVPVTAVTARRATHCGRLTGTPLAVSRFTRGSEAEAGHFSKRCGTLGRHAPRLRGHACVRTRRHGHANTPRIPKNCRSVAMAPTATRSNKVKSDLEQVSCW